MPNNYDDMRASRDFDKNPPDMAPGMGGDGWGSLFDDSNDPLGGDISSMLNSGGGQTPGIPNDPMSPGIGVQPGGLGIQPGGFGGPGGMGATGGQQDKPIEDKIFDAGIVGAKGFIQFMKALVESFRNNKPEDWHKLGVRLFWLSLITLGSGFLLSIIGVFVKSISGTGDLIVSGALSIIISVLIIFNTPGGKGKKSEELSEAPNEDDLGLGSDLSNDFPSEGIDFTDDGLEVVDEEESEDSIWDEVLDDSEDLFTPANSADSDDFSVEDAVEDIEVIKSGQYTRQFLFETFEKVLPIINPTFGDMVEISEDDNEFYDFVEMLEQSTYQTGVTEEKLPQLQHVRKNLFVIQLEATRPTGLKEDQIAEGVAQLYRMGGVDGYQVLDDREAAYATVASVVGKLIINIFLGNPEMVSLGAVFQKKKDFILNPKCTMPLIWGINELGKVLCYDGMKAGNGGMLISGESRSGKSWKGQSLIAQMCMFMSPKELNFYFFDVKGTKSDYYYLGRHIPHAKGFCSDPLKFTTELKKILDREVSYRERLLGEEYTNVKDYNKDHPFEKIPTVYIVVDEMAAAMKAMDTADKEIHKEFDAQLIAIATKYPYLEIKLLVFPHRIVNDIISKTVSSMISCRSVMGSMNFEELKSSLDIPNKKAFPYNLVAQGDMAIRTKDLSNGNAVYCHAEVLSSEESVNRKIFDYIGAVWQKLEPDCELMPALGSSAISKKSGVKKTARDNSFADISGGRVSEVNPVDSVIEELGEDTSVDESFWEEELGVSKEEPIKSSESKDDDDDFWSNF